MIVIRCCALLFLFFLLGCLEDTRPYQRESSVTQELSKFSKEGPEGATLRLADVTEFSWDSVAFFLDGTPKSDINEVIGSSLFSEESSRYYEAGPLLVFRDGEKAVHAVAIIPPLYLSGVDRRVYSVDETVVVAESKGSPFALRLGE